MNLHKISLAQGTYSMRLFGPDSVFIDDFLLVFATVLANELLASFTFMDALKFPDLISGVFTLG